MDGDEDLPDGFSWPASARRSSTTPSSRPTTPPSTRPSKAGQAREADALNALHATLDSTQRQALAGAGEGAGARPTSAADAAPDGGPIDWGKNRLVRLTAELSLDDAQQKAVAALLAKDTTMTPAAIQARRDAGQKRIDTLLTEFAKDTFDAKKLDLSQGGGKTPHDTMERHATMTRWSAHHPAPRPAREARGPDGAHGQPSRRNFDDMEPGPSPGGPDDDTACRARPR